MKPQEITKEEYEAICEALWEKALTYTRGKTYAANAFFSSSSITCAYENDPPKSFRSWPFDNVSMLCHFLPHPCDCKEHATMHSQTKAICLCATQNSKYYLTEHRIGQCPWKEVF